MEEFGEALRSQARDASAGPAPESLLDNEAWTARILARPPEVRLGDCLAQAWGLWMANAGLFFGASALVWLVSLAQFLPFGPLVYLVLRGALFGGLYLIVLNRIRGKTAAVGDLFAGISGNFMQLVLAGVVSSVPPASPCASASCPGFTYWLPGCSASRWWRIGGWNSGRPWS